jgi:hypothetical protein
MGVRVFDLLVLAIVVVCTGSTAMNVDLASLLRSRQRQQLAAHKRKVDGGNPCPEPEKPFPCKTTSTCLPMRWVCDDNYDCEDGYDEDKEVCTAAHRQPVVDIMHFLDSEKWLMPVFGGKSISKIAHALAVSQNLDDFKRRVGLSKQEAGRLQELLDAVKHGEEDLVVDEFGMDAGSWNEVSWFFNDLIKSGFDN